MEIGPHVFPKSGTQTHRQTDVCQKFVNFQIFLIPRVFGAPIRMTPVDFHQEYLGHHLALTA